MRVAIALSDTGLGHRSLSEAVRHGLQSFESIHCDVHDIFGIANVPVGRSLPQFYTRVLGRHPWAFSGIYRASDSRRAMDAVAAVARQRLGTRLASSIDDLAPDLLIATHPVVATILGALRSSIKSSPELVVVVCDPVTVHAAWAVPAADRTFVFSESAREQLARAGVDRGRITVHESYPVRPEFCAEEAFGEARVLRELGLHQSKMVLVTSGAAGAGVERLSRALARHLSHVAVVGTVPDQPRKRRSSARNLRLVNTRTEMPALMAAADVVVGKAGPSTLAESMAVGAPFVATHTGGPQEHGNVDALRRLGAAVVTAESESDVLLQVRQALLRERRRHCCRSVDRGGISLASALLK